MIFDFIDFLLIFSVLSLMIFMSIEDLIAKKVSLYPFLFFILICILWIFKQKFFPITFIPIGIAALVIKCFEFFGKKLVANADIIFIIFSSVWFDILEIPFFIFNAGLFVFITFLIKKFFSSFVLKKNNNLNCYDFEELKVPFFPAITLSTFLSFLSSYLIN